MFCKETVMPHKADARLFKLAPLIGFATAIITLALVPFGPDWVTESWGPIPLQIARVGERTCSITRLKGSSTPFDSSPSRIAMMSRCSPSLIRMKKAAPMP